MNPSFQQTNQQALSSFDSDTAVAEADKATPRPPSPSDATTATTTPMLNNTTQLTEAQLVRRIEVVAKFIGMTLHSGAAKNFSKRDPTCKLAIDFCTAILQQSGRRLSSFSNSHNETDGSTTNNNATNVATLVAETLPPQIETVLQQLSVAELAGACFIMNYVYSRITSRENYKHFFVVEGYDPAQSTMAAGRLLGCVLMDPALLQKIASGGSNSYGGGSSTKLLDKTTESADKNNKDGVAKATVGLAHESELQDPEEGASGQQPHQAGNKTSQEEDDRKMPAKTTVAPPPMTTTAASTPPNPFTSMAQMQSRILSIRHACYCSADNEDKTTSSCSLMSPAKCQYFKKLYKHVIECSSEECNVPQCLETKLLLLHYRDCESVLCPLCVPIKFYVAKNAQTANQNKHRQQLSATAAAAATTAAAYQTSAAKVSPAALSVARKESPGLFGSMDYATVPKDRSGNRGHGNKTNGNNNSSNNSSSHSSANNNNKTKHCFHLAETTEFQENSYRNSSQMMMDPDDLAATTITTRSATRASRHRRRRLPTNVASASFPSKKPRVDTPSLPAPAFKA